MKLSKRLQTIEKLVTQHYDHIWDCCCDHGFLGMTLLQRMAETHVHFVDIVPDLMALVQQRLEHYFPLDSGFHWQTHCQDVGALPLSDYAGTHLVIIAGVGGDLMSELVSRMTTDHPNTAIEFLLCPVHHVYTLRQQLHQLGAQCITETLLEDNRRYYEVLHVAVNSASPVDDPVSMVGSQIWRPNNEYRDVAQRYHAKLLAHYARMQQSTPEKVAPILAAYQAVQLGN
ncbi:tRNA (adenine(22)-N(1))-methyltransferase [Vibrio furnissii]|uniref:tRNA (adenine(22)-N(1))-methyltransferase n=1 Tax=Vibrio furnissii TaxID=29494 RepID=UPI0012AD3812|nr:tRNA (adenine(22)-N(1))-methyltransferase TrmK [Vibrio furnissii]